MRVCFNDFGTQGYNAPEGPLILFNATGCNVLLSAQVRTFAGSGAVALGLAPLVATLVPSIAFAIAVRRNNYVRESRSVHDWLEFTTGFELNKTEMA